ncbi:MAG TPA: DUF2961 domain-containing protein [Polyangiales bacterium]|nr:DUF2961 domain-containing protein [Polyangiales bacterium]
MVVRGRRVLCSLLALAALGCNSGAPKPHKSASHASHPTKDPSSDKEPTPTAAEPDAGPAAVPEAGSSSAAKPDNPPHKPNPPKTEQEPKAGRPDESSAEPRAPHSLRPSPVVAVPLNLGTLAGTGMPRAQTSLNFYGTDLGLSFEHKGQHWMIFGDTWPSVDHICEERPANDDTLATLPLSYRDGEMPALEFRTLPEATNDLSYVQLLRGSESLRLGYGQAPLAAFSEGERAFALFERLEPHRCDAPYAQGAGACPTDHGFQCAKDLGVCEPAYLPFTSVCDAARGEGCFPGQTCKATTLCLDPSSSQYGDGSFTSRERALAHTLEFGLSREDRPEVFDSVLAFPTNKFSIPATRTVTKFTGKLDGNDWKAGKDTVLIWGRPGTTAEHERDGHLYLMAHRLPLPLDKAGKLEFAPQYFAGIDAKSGEPIWSAHQAEAKAIALDGKLDGDPHEPVQIMMSMTVSWLGAPINKWMMLYGGDLADWLLLDAEASRGARAPGAIWVRFADQPWGPFSPPLPHLAPGLPQRINDAYGPGGYLFSPDCSSTRETMCAASDPHRPLDTALGGCQLETVDPGRLYSPNIIDNYTRPNDQGGLDVFWNVSTWNPYSVRLFKTRIQPPGSGERAHDELADSRALERLSSWKSLPLLGEIQRYTQHSSYDRSTSDFTLPLTDHGNRDFNNFVCASKDAVIAADQMAPFKYDLAECPEDYVHGVVLSRFEGSGRMVRMWLGMQSLLFAPADDEVLRIYVDDDPQPHVDVPLIQALDGRAGEIFAPPFGAGSQSRLSWYYPVSFQKKLIVALDRMGEYDNYFYHCDYVSDAQTHSTGSRERLPEREAALAQLGAVFHPAGTSKLLTDPVDLKLAPNATRTLELAGPATVQEFSVRVRDADYASLARVMLQVRWDGAAEPAFDVSLADLLGGSVPPERSSLALTSVLEASDRVLTLKLPMPFHERAELRFTNTAQRDAVFSLRLSGSHTVPAERYGYLHVQRHETLGPSNAAQRVAVSARGRGRLVGVCNEVVGHPDPQAGIQYSPLNLLEGDPRIEVDGQLALNGTGSEEYADDVFYFVDAPHANAFVQAWGVVEDTSQRPPGRASFCRWHVLGTELDFDKSLEMTFELGGAANPSIVDRHKSIAYLYLAD